MYYRLYERFGTTGLVVAVIALIVALAGTAIAAAGLTAKQKKEVGRIAKKFVRAGPQGPIGPTGPAGPIGPIGPTGDRGANGRDGAPGTSVRVTPIAPGGAECSGRLGATVEEEGSGAPVEVCEGSPWTAGGTLPEGATETGNWFIHGIDKAKEEYLFTPISFPIRLENAPIARFVKGDESTPSECEGNVEEPGAKEGFLCIFEALRTDPTHHPYANLLFKGGLSFIFVFKPGGYEVPGPGPTGGMLLMETEEPTTPGEEVSTGGSWAVKAK